MNNEEKGNSSEPEDIPSTGTGSNLETTKLPEAGPEDTNPDALIATKALQAVEATEQQVDADGSSSSSEDREPQTGGAASSVAAEQEMAELPVASSEDANPSVPTAMEKPEAVKR